MLVINASILLLILEMLVGGKESVGGKKIVRIARKVFIGCGAYLLAPHTNAAFLALPTPDLALAAL